MRQFLRLLAVASIALFCFGRCNPLGDFNLSGPYPPSLAGTVTSSGNMLADVQVEAQGKSARTSLTGYYAIAGVTSGSAMVTASKDGFQTFTKQIEIGEGSNTLNIEMLAAQ